MARARQANGRNRMGNSFESEIEKKVGIGLALFRLEYTTKHGNFDTNKYQLALKNFNDTIEELGILPDENFFLLGVEHFHLLDNTHKEMLRSLVKTVDKIEEETEIREFEKFPEVLKRLADKYKLND